ncbi:hypothetical protein O0I10_003151 [Lichtheimia ornata]|uniref:Uncharacterized protein n=1 Tax=Lichtheimia ornata TaxID=688661 RepID=A0AAD7V8E5_9FUNG|nr:uncharacterized protein O0I10_003151 [Lichtheimia ornata]KAJ8660929.1 hypothetical protein O0I10_003151 [Lichtheimia ornata]
MSLSEFPHHSASQIPSSSTPRHSLDSNTINRHHTMVAPVAAVDVRYEQQHLERQGRRDRSSVPHRISVPNRRYNYRDPLPPPPTPSSYYSSLSSPRSNSKQSSSDMIELLFTKLLDALIFTSAIAITAYNYWTGSLNNSRQQGTITAGPSSSSSSSSSTPRTPLSPMTLQFPSPVAVNDIRPSSWRQQQYNMHKMYDDNDPQQHQQLKRYSSTSTLEDSRRKRTLKWAESVSHQQQQHKPKTPTKEREYNPDDNNDDETSSSTSTIRISRSSKRRTQSLPPAPLNIQNQHGAQDAHEKEDEMFNRMEERLQSLIEQGQAALSSRVDVDDHLDENEIAMRRAFAARKKYSF